MQKRIYTITHRETGVQRLVSAGTPAQAMRFVAAELFEVKAASAKVVANLMSTGHRLEEAVSEAGQE